MMRNNLNWYNPREILWGFHVHQELPLNEFAKALVTQKNCVHFLQQQNIPINNDDCLQPGYGPHLDYMWELRVESAREYVLEKLGLAISFMAVNRFNLSGYIHPLMHDAALPEFEALAAEGYYNQTNALWFGYKVPQNQDFFFNPPRDKDNKLVDTRTPRILSLADKAALLHLGMSNMDTSSTNDPYQIILNGFHIHMDYVEHDAPLGALIFDKFISFLFEEQIAPTSTRFYAPDENGPHILGGWEVKFETSDWVILEKIGVAIGWLMCNRQGLPVFMHPVTWVEGDYREELKAHERYSFFLGHMPELNLRFFSDKFTGAKE